MLSDAHKNIIRTENTKMPREDIVTQNCQNIKQHDSPVLHSAEGLFIGDVVHEDEAHGPAVVRSGDGSVALLACCVLHRQYNLAFNS